MIYKTRAMLMAAVAVLAFGAAEANAAVITYTITGAGTGFADGNAFNTDFVFTLTGDTANYVTGVLGILDIIDPLNSAVISLSGVGNFTVTESTRLGFANFGNAVFFSRSSGLDLFDFNTAASLDLISAFSVAGTGVFALNQFVNLPTNNGLLTFSTSSDVIFSSNVIGPGGVPEPASWALMIAGFGSVGAAARRKSRVRVTYA